MSNSASPPLAKSRTITIHAVRRMPLGLRGVAKLCPENLRDQSSDWMTTLTELADNPALG